ncbi:hypothetical protein JW905_13210 [bacterium]|nr:hypothetical protein [candidate division CSSED10-310 bacterium]
MTSVRLDMWRRLSGASCLRPAVPNIRTGAQGYTWGRPAAESRIQGMLSRTDPPGPGPVLSDHEPVAELWLLVDDPVFPDLINLAGGNRLPLSELFQEYGPELLGEAHLARHGVRLGVAAKIIDTAVQVSRGTLSAQVHRRETAGCGAKPETWFGLAEGSFVHAGLRRTMNHEEFVASCRNGAIEHLMHRFDLSPGAVFHVPGGLPHAIGCDTTLLEISVAPTDADPRPLGERTVSFYDRWGGRQARENKEQPELAADLIAQAGFLNAAPPALLTWDLVTSAPGWLLRVTRPHKEYLFARLQVDGEVDDHSLQHTGAIPGDGPLMLLVLNGCGTLLTCRAEPLALHDYLLVPHCDRGFTLQAEEPLDLAVWMP